MATFLVIAYDGRDDQAMARRLAAREAHLAGARKMAEAGQLLEGGPLMSDDGENMVGSFCVVDFFDRDALDAWLAADPYVTGDVWRTITVHPVKTGTWK